MIAWQVASLGEPVDVMRLGEVPEPEPGPDQVVVEVLATALNFPDVLLARGQYQDRPPLPFTPGVEMCGRVVKVGPRGPAHLVGERVLGTVVLPHGALARYAVAGAREVFRTPAGLDDDACAALHIAYQTAWFALHRRAGLRVGQTVLVHAAAGGVGSAAVQLAKVAGARVIGVVGPGKVEVARRLGCDLVLERGAGDQAGQVEQVKRFTEGRGVDVAFDPVGGDAYALSSKVIAFEGRVVVVGFAGGQVPAPALNHALVKNYSILGLHWGLYRRHDPDLVRRCHDELSELAAVGALRPLVSRTVPFEEAPEALARLAAGDTVGRVVVRAAAG